MTSTRRDCLKHAVVVAMLGLLAACATAPPPSPPLPPPPPPPQPPAVVEAVPYRPIPPDGAAYVMVLPPLGPDGGRLTLNSNLNADDTLWHFRSAWNVAALNCVATNDGPILEGYAAFLKKYARPLTAANAAIDARFRRQHGSRDAGIKARESYMTQVYNYFALPPARAEFCAAALAVATEYLAAPPDDPNALAAAALPRLEAVFQEFFRQYRQYQVDSAAWDARYGSLYGASQPGYVAVHGVLAQGFEQTATTSAVQAASEAD